MELKVELDQHTIDRLASRASRREYDSPEAYAAEVLRIVMDELEGDDDHVETQLQDLGYLE